MDTIVNFACTHAHSAHWFIFILLLLGGLNIPISEDILILSAGAIASTCIPDHTLFLFVWIYMGCILGAWETYWLGRYFGPRLYDLSWFKHIVTPQRIKKLHHYYEKFGVLTFMVIRFCPGGVRNALFLTAGLGNMPFYKFILRDGFALSISVTAFFFIGYRLGENYRTIIGSIQTYSHVVFACVSILIVCGGIYLWIQSRNKTVV